jgi:hypothetical protein
MAAATYTSAPMRIITRFMHRWNRRRPWGIGPESTQIARPITPLHEALAVGLGCDRSTFDAQAPEWR